MINSVTNTISASSVQGIKNAESQFQAAASKIASFAGSLQNPQAPDTVDLSSQMTALMSARDNFMANVEASKTGDQLQRDLLNVVA